MTKVYLKSHEKAQAILDFLETNPLSSAKRIAEELQLGLSTVYNTIDDLGDLLDRKSVRTSHQHRATVFSISKSDDRKVVINKANEYTKSIPSRDPITSALFRTRAT